MSIPLQRAACAGACDRVLASPALAHEIVGNRFFPATLGIDDPGVNDELSIPTVDAFKTGDDPPVKQRDVSGEFSKRITEDFAISLGATYTWLSAPGGPDGAGASGWQNLETTFKYRIYRNPEHEFVASIGLGVEWGGTGVAKVGADPFNAYTPTIFFGKGLGDLPDTVGMAQAVRDHGPGRLRNSRAALDHHVQRRPRLRRHQCRHRGASRRAGCGAEPCNTACPI